MDLALSREDEAFQDEVRRFLDENLTEDLREAGRKTGGVFADFAAGLRWHRILARRGWSASSWPKEHGGTGWSATQRYIFSRECTAADAPRIFSMGLRMVGPVIMKFGTPEQKAKYLPRILSGDITFCQGYSEPGSGSDLASLKTRAERDGDDYVITGTKIWTTGAHAADHMFCLVRTSTEGKPQDGISFVLIDSMKTPGLSVSPILTLAGDHEVNQVFLDNVRTPVANRIGPENAGWTVAKYLLEFERGGDAYTPNLHARLDDVKRIAREEAADGSGRLIEERGFVERLAETEMEIQALEMIEMQVLSDLSQGRNPGAISSAMKIRGSETLQKLDHLGVEALSWYAAPFEPEARELGHNEPTVTPAWGITAMPLYLNNRASTIYAGSNEIQRNIIAKAVLGL
ncbi:acyl-CoA dehydrogenase family protein [Reyranella sp. MMS21-HV4-11]|jgi:alkylation response protein AidB-like acyl-CoA dehydrogenase|uniref:Acyl-CoA dehydrogenase family protein n=1 Tax=Reyranella humidisoli TaxID=2849149 RepID=A0ABS6IP81_9HYPH|nr:acyl-CoA dehydrogenase family protein [Reyranella sp. MMS21-HV4-11]MBU8876175.1 acyl-CoA dehydrogenase family protein [Reyranella sp. MMS21-HV4-11]